MEGVLWGRPRPGRGCMPYMDGWMDGRMGGWIDGWVDGWMDGRMDGWMDGWMDGGWMEIEYDISFTVKRKTFHNKCQINVCIFPTELQHFQNASHEDLL